MESHNNKSTKTKQEEEIQNPRSKKERHKGGKGRSLREKRRSLVGKRCKAEGDRTKMVHKLISLENRLEDSPEQAQQADG